MVATRLDYTEPLDRRLLPAMTLAARSHTVRASPRIINRGEVMALRPRNFLHVRSAP
jgi:hypothetical protein